MKKEKNKKIFFLLLYTVLFAALLALDIGIKYLTVTRIAKIDFLHPDFPFGGIAVFQKFLGFNLSLNYIANLGAAWGLFSQYSSVLFCLRIALVMGLFVFIFFFNKEKRNTIPLLLIVTGALGNVLDWIFYGHVVDMFHFTTKQIDFPVFNFADFLITLGIGWLFMLSFFSKKKSKEKICKSKS